MEDRLRTLLRERLGLDAGSVVRIDHGWDSIVFVVDGDWIVRVPRRPEVREALRREAALLPLLAPQLPVAVPQVAVFEDASEFFVAYPRLEGEPLRHGVENARLGADAGSFLAALHAFPRSAALRASFESVSLAAWLDGQRAFAGRCEQVMSLLTREEQQAAHALFTDYLERSHDFDPVVLHGDLGPEHLLAKAGRLSGVIDWGDARIGDPALDLAWLLYGTGASFATEVLRAYGGDGDLRRRALYFRRLGPWHEVLFGLKHDRPNLVDSGLTGVRARLP